MPCARSGRARGGLAWAYSKPQPGSPAPSLVKEGCARSRVPGLTGHHSCVTVWEAKLKQTANEQILRPTCKTANSDTPGEEPRNLYIKNKKQKQKQIALQLLTSAKFEHHGGRPSISKPLHITTGNQMAPNHCLILESKVASGTSHTGLFQGLSESAYGGPRVVLGMEQVLSSWKLLAFLHSAKTY